MVSKLRSICYGNNHAQALVMDPSHLYMYEINRFHDNLLSVLYSARYRYTTLRT